MTNSENREDREIGAMIAESIAKKIARFIALAIAGIIAITIFIFLGGFLVQWLWNWLLPPMFNVPQITFWQALGLLALCRILFGGSGFMSGWRGDRRHRDFSPEEKARFRQRVRERFGMGQPG